MYLLLDFFSWSIFFEKIDGSPGYFILSSLKEYFFYEIWFLDNWSEKRKLSTHKYGIKTYSIMTVILFISLQNISLYLPSMSKMNVKLVCRKSSLPMGKLFGFVRNCNLKSQIIDSVKKKNQNHETNQGNQVRAFKTKIIGSFSWYCKTLYPQC